MIRAGRGARRVELRRTAEQPLREHAHGQERRRDEDRHPGDPELRERGVAIEPDARRAGPAIRAVASPAHPDDRRIGDVGRRALIALAHAEDRDRRCTAEQGGELARPARARREPARDRGLDRGVAAPHVAQLVVGERRKVWTQVRHWYAFILHPTTQ